MLRMSKTQTGNGILDSLAQSEQHIMFPRFERRIVKGGDILNRAGERIAYAYFPVNCVLSMVTIMRDGTTIEVAMIGREGFIGTPLVWDVDTLPHQTLCYIGGEACRIRADLLRKCLQDVSSLRLMMQRHAQALYFSMAQSIACNRFHTLAQRSARWLLSTHDRIDGDDFLMTQEYVALALGVNRQSVSVAAQQLQSAGFIEYSRGHLRIIDRNGLKSAACECYQLIANQYKRLLSTTRR